MGLRWPTIPRRAASVPAAGRSVRGVLIRGPFGAGKTTLARTVASRAHRECLWVAGTESCRDVPLGAFAELAEFGTDPDPAAVTARIRRSFRGREDTRIVVDDADLLDPLSALLVAQLTEDGPGRLVVTCTDCESGVGRTLLATGRFEQVALPAFDPTEVRRAVEEAVGRPVDRSATRSMWEVSEGNPLFLRHLVEGTWDAGRFHSYGGVWQLSGRPVLSAELTSLLGASLRTIPPDVVDVLSLATFGGALDVEILRGLASPDAVAAAVVSGHLRIDRERTARLTHPVLGIAIESTVGELAAHTQRRRLALALRAGHPIRSAVLSLDSGTEVGAPDLVAAAEQAFARGDEAAAERMAVAAVARGGGIRAALVAARSMRWRGRSAALEALLGAIDPRTLSEPERTAWAVCRAGVLYADNRVVDARRELSMLLARPTTAATRRLVECAAAAFDFHSGDLAGPLELADRLTGAEWWPAPALTAAAAVAGCALARAGCADRVPPLAMRAYTAAGSATVETSGLGVAEMVAVTLAGYLAVVDGLLERYPASDGGDRPRAVTDAYIRGLADLSTGRLGHAENEFRRAGSVAERCGQRMWIALCAVGLAQALGARGRVGEGAAALARAESVFGAYLGAFEPDLALARAWVEAARGERRRAAATARCAARRARARSMFGVEVVALHTSTRFGDRSAAGRLRILARRVDGPFVRAAARHAGALEAHDGDGLDRAAEEFADMGAILLAADAASQAAVVHRSDGDTGKELLSAATAQRLSAQCGGPRTPALVAARNSVSLTERERLVVSLVADGMTNRQVAERLTVSVRTVEGHLYRAFGKLGIGGREELAARVSPLA
ncbi:LuxR C-terminal-related transcriptional regulator [Rhodococcus sp. NPDC003318]|uniref:LuxR C-terminal-related transcriptional regulator n=1 Tax=Rhodococcus sp. NPDC003318 TaxID=3364503 RepID=UPI00369EA0FA